MNVRLIRGVRPPGSADTGGRVDRRPLRRLARPTGPAATGVKVDTSWASHDLSLNLSQSQSRRRGAAVRRRPHPPLAHAPPSPRSLPARHRASRPGTRRSFGRSVRLSRPSGPTRARDASRGEGRWSINARPHSASGSDPAALGGRVPPSPSMRLPPPYARAAATQGADASHLKVMQ